LTLELLGPIRQAHEDLGQRLEHLRRITNDQRLSTGTRERFFLGLQYLRRAITDISSSGQFLHAWIGLEATVAGAQRTDVSDIRRAVSRLIASGYPRRTLVDLRDSLLRNGVQIDDAFRREVYEAPAPTAAVALWSRLRDPASLATLEGAITEHPLLRLRVRQTAETLGTPGAVEKSIERSREDVDWHIQRMYRLRNAIAHGSGTVPHSITVLASHLATYLWVIVRATMTEFARPAGITEMRAYFDRSNWLYEQQLRVLREGQPLDLMSIVWPETMIR
jgi:hypothetical protein